MCSRPERDRMHFRQWKRRELITLLGGAAALPLAARAQQGGRMRRIGVLSSLAADDPETQARHAAFLQGLQEWGWTTGRNVQIDYRWGAGDGERFRKHAMELVALTPDVILATGTPVTAALLQATRSVPIVFAPVVDPVANGFVDSLARPANPDAAVYISRRRVNDAFLRAALESFHKDGPVAFQKCARENPASYLKIFALLIPRELKIE